MTIPGLLRGLCISAGCSLEAWGTACLTFAQVRVDAHVTRRARQALVLPVGDVFFGLGVYVLFGQTKVDDVDGVLPLAAGPPHQEVLRLHVSVYQALGVHVLHPCYLAGRDWASF